MAKRKWTVQRACMVQMIQNVVVEADSEREACEVASRGFRDDGSYIEGDNYDTSDPGETFIVGVAAGVHRSPAAAPASCQREVPEELAERAAAVAYLAGLDGVGEGGES